MSNLRFDRLVARQNLQAAKQAVGEWGRALVRTDIEVAEVKFLAGSFVAARKWQADAQSVVDGGWGW